MTTTALWTIPVYTGFLRPSRDLTIQAPSLHDAWCRAQDLLTDDEWIHAFPEFAVTLPTISTTTLTPIGA